MSRTNRCVFRARPTEPCQGLTLQVGQGTVRSDHTGQTNWAFGGQRDHLERVRRRCLNFRLSEQFKEISFMLAYVVGLKVL